MSTNKVNDNNIFNVKINSKKLNTLYPTEVINNYFIDPSIMKFLLKKTGKKRNVTLYDYTDKNSYVTFVKDISSNLLKSMGYNHTPDIFYIDVIRYELIDVIKPVDSGLAWHVENDNYPDLVSVLHYLRLDDSIKDGNLKYKDKYGKTVKNVIMIVLRTKPK